MTQVRGQLLTTLFRSFFCNLLIFIFMWLIFYPYLHFFRGGGDGKFGCTSLFFFSNCYSLLIEFLCLFVCSYFPCFVVSDVFLVFFFSFLRAMFLRFYSLSLFSVNCSLFLFVCVLIPLRLLYFILI